MNIQYLLSENIFTEPQGIQCYECDRMGNSKKENEMVILKTTTLPYETKSI